MASACLIYQRDVNGVLRQCGIGYRLFFVMVVLYSWLLARTWGETIWSEKKRCDLNQFGNMCLDSTHPQKAIRHTILAVRSVVQVIC